MKKKITQCISVILAFVMILGVTPSIQAKPHNSAKQKWYNNDTHKYAFPITSSSEKWKNFESHDEMVAACTVPQEVLKDMSTDKLLELVLDYPLLGDIRAYSSYTEGLECIKSQFNGLEELLNRDECANALLNKYSEIKITKESTISDDVKNKMQKYIKAQNISGLMNMVEETEELSSTLQRNEKELTDIIFLETALAQDTSINKMTSVQKEKLNVEAEKKYKEKTESETFNTYESTFYDTIISNKNYKKLNIVYKEKTSTTSTKALSPFITVYTPKGTAITALRSGNSLTSSQIASSASWVKTNYPKATIVSPADDSYNCHSYAWYSQSVNHVWINSPKAYVTDGSYKRVGTSPTANKQRAVWINAATTSYYVHSGYVTAYSSKTITSKWGQMPLVKHSAGYSPYGGTVYYYK